MKKISYEIVALQVENMFNQTIFLTDTNQIDKIFKSIRIFIESCGWNYDQYVDHMNGCSILNKN